MPGASVAGRPAVPRGARYGARLLLTALSILLAAPVSAVPSLPAAPYTVSISPTGDPALDRALSDASLLVSLAERAPVGAFGLVSRAEADLDRLDRVLRGFGYYDALPAVRIAGNPLDAPDLMARLASLPGERPLEVAVDPDPGPLYRLGEVQLAGDLPAEARAAFDLAPGDPARAADVLASGEAVLTALREAGHALARVPPPDALVDHDARTLDVRFQPEPGPRLALGEVAIVGLERLREGWVRRRLGLAVGEPFSPSRIEAARRSLLASGTVAWARLTPAQTADAAGRLPLTLELAERPRRSLRLSGAFSSDEGLSASVSWQHRNLWGGAEQLTLRGEIQELGGGGVGDLGNLANLGYLAEASLRVPDLWLRDLDLRVDLGAVSESPDAFDRDAVSAGVALERRFSERLLVSAGVAWERSRVAQDAAPEDYRLLSLPLTLTRDTSDDPLDPRRGTRLALRAAPTRELSDGGPGFTLVRAVGSAYLDLGAAWDSGPLAAIGGEPAAATAASGSPLAGTSEPPASAGRAVLAGRLVLGSLIGAAAPEVPPDWRFYAGGGGSVRGYPFQSIGPRTPSGSPAGGDALLEASVELRLAGLCCAAGAGEAAGGDATRGDDPRRPPGLAERARGGWGAGPWGAALFADLGAVSREDVPGLDAFAVGVGAGLRYATPIGPVRVDLAAPLDRDYSGASLQLYIGIGQAF